MAGQGAVRSFGLVAGCFYGYFEERKNEILVYCINCGHNGMCSLNS